MLETNHFTMSEAREAAPAARSDVDTAYTASTPPRYVVCCIHCHTLFMHWRSPRAEQDLVCPGCGTVENVGGR